MGFDIFLFLRFFSCYGIVVFLIFQLIRYENEKERTKITYQQNSEVQRAWEAVYKLF
jgi:hypothetical protein